MSASNQSEKRSRQEAYPQAFQDFVKLNPDPISITILRSATQLSPERWLLKDATEGPLPRRHVAIPITQRQVWLDSEESIQILEEQDLVPAEAIEPSPLTACLVNVADAPGEETLHVRQPHQAGDLLVMHAVVVAL